MFYIQYPNSKWRFSILGFPKIGVPLNYHHPYFNHFFPNKNHPAIGEYQAFTHRPRGAASAIFSRIWVLGLRAARLSCAKSWEQRSSALWNAVETSGIKWSVHVGYRLWYVMIIMMIIMIIMFMIIMIIMILILIIVSHQYDMLWLIWYEIPWSSWDERDEILIFFDPPDPRF